jgi:hypothetical protein
VLKLEIGIHASCVICIVVVIGARLRNIRNQNWTNERGMLDDRRSYNFWINCIRIWFDMVRNVHIWCWASVGQTIVFTEVGL